MRAYLFRYNRGSRKTIQLAERECLSTLTGYMLIEDELIKDANITVSKSPGSSYFGRDKWVEGLEINKETYLYGDELASNMLVRSSLYGNFCKDYVAVTIIGTRDIESNIGEYLIIYADNKQDSVSLRKK